ncbi:LamG domain-containing protein [Solwaraspora sp. WMMA2056]|uniref:LamG domain-containing protein n=1 Tax=Solwaraspora sp. WMMA2056 TaxID=3015161 RepID=UPI00259B062E|nr:LamG domain-containing protein [Solwaraspora sp. WMMA2056]WJK40206.1 LamG domain-containing protein [Solwaraspora sp. WMMA2056]
MAAERIAEACAVRVEALDLRDEYSQVYVEPDGSRTLESAVVPQRVRTGADSWTPVSTELTERTDGRLAPAATTADVSFSGDGTGPLVAVRMGEHEFTLSWPEPLSAPTVQGDTAVYGSVFPDTDLHVIATPTGYRHVLEVKTAQAAVHPDLGRIRYVFGGDITPQPLTEGGLRLVDPDGRTVGVTPTASMWDSSVDPSVGGEVTAGRDAAGSAVTPDPSTAAGPGPAAPMVPIEVDVATGDLEVVPDPSVLAGAETVYPVFIDPAFDNKSTRWAYANNINTNWDIGNRAWVGRNSYDGALYRSFFDFNVWQIRGKRILSAQVRAKLDHSWSCSATWVHLYRTAGVSATPRMSWGTRPLPSSKWLAAQEANANEAGGCGVIQPDVDVEFGGSTLTTDVQYAVNQQWTGYTVGLCACNSSGQYESTQDRWKKFYVDQTWLIVSYNSRPGIPTELTTSSVACGGVVGTTSPTLRARYVDPDGSDTLTGRFEWKDVTSPTATQTNGPSRPANNFGEITLNLGAGAEGKTFVWRVYTTDAHDGSDWSGACHFTVNASAPPAPGITSSDYPSGPTAHGGPGQSGSFTFTAGGAPDVTTYVYGWSNPPGNQVTVSPGSSRTVTLTPPKHGLNMLYVYSKDTAGTPSPTTPYQFLVGSPAAPIGHWPLNTVNGHGLTDTAGDADLMASGDVTWPADTRLIGESVPFFDSIDESPNNLYGSASATVSDLDTAGSFSVSAWVRASALTGGNRTAVSQDDTDFSGFYLGIRYLGSPPAPYWSFMMGNSPSVGSNHRADSGSPITAADIGKWTHLAAVHDAQVGVMRLYVNGELAAETTRSAVPWTATGPVVVGRALWYGALTDSWRGEVTDLRIWNRVIVADDLQGTNADPQAGTIAMRGILSPVRVGMWDFSWTADCWCGEAIDDERWGRDLYLAGWDSVPASATFTEDGHDDGDAAWFDGASGYASTTDPYTLVQNPVVRTDQSFTVSAWAQLDGDPADPLPAGNISVVAQEGTQVDAFALGYQAAAQRWAFWLHGADVSNSSTSAAVTSPVVPVPGEWFHLVGVYDAGTESVTLYVNGQAAGPVFLSAPTWAAAGSLTLARELWNGNLGGYFPGTIDQVTVYVGVMNAREVNNLYTTS